MKNKILKIVFTFILFTALFVTASFAVEIKEDVDDYGSGAFILGSTRFDINQVITATVAAKAGVNEARLSWFLGNDFDDVDMTFYYYNSNAKTWFSVGEETKALTEKEKTELEKNLNIVFVNNVEKTIEIDYSGTVDTTTISDKNVKFENGKFLVPITVDWFMFESEDGVENEVVTNTYDKIIESIETGAEVEADEVEIIPEWAAITVNGEYFAEDKIAEAIAKSSPTNEAKLLQPIFLDSSIVFDTQENMNAVLNLNWYDLSTSIANYAIELKAPNSTLTIKNGYIYGNKYGAIKADCKHLTDSKVTLNIEETANIQGYDYGIVIFGNKATANIKGTVKAINENGYAISGNGNKGWGGTELNISGNAQIWAEEGVGIYIPQEGITNISGNAYIEGKTAIAMKAGELNVLGGSIYGDGNLIQIPAETNDGTNPTGDAIYVESNKGYAGNVKISISEDAYVYSKYGAPVRVYKSNSNDDITITGKYSTAYVNKEENKNIVYEQGQAALKVGATKYSWDSVDYAIDLLESGKETTLTLLEDVELTEGIVITGTATINLNGKTLSAHDSMPSYALIKVDGGNLTIGGEGIVNSASHGNDYSMAVWVAESGVATINGGTYTNVGAKFMEDNGIKPNNNELIYANGSGKIIINKGTFTGNTDNITHGVKYTLNIKDKSDAQITVKGGTFTRYNPANSASENPRMNFLAEGYKVVFADDKYTVTSIEEADAILADGMAYTDLQTAVNNASKVKLLKDIDLPTAVVVSTKVTLDLNGKTLTAKNDTVGDGIFTVITGGDLTINGEGTIDSACQTNDYSMAIWAKETGKVTINGGTFTNLGAKDKEDDGDANNNELIYARDSAQIVINGGTFIGNTSNETHKAKFTLNLRDQDNEVASIVVKGGTFKGYDPANSRSENPTKNLVAEGYESIFNETNNIYTVVEKAN